MYCRLLIMLFILLPAAHALSEYETTLLTVNENNHSEGGTAKAYLELREGTGRIFIDSFPVSRTDTQFSTRFANEVACDFLRAACDEYDFLYTIRADSAIVGGPSAGAALTILTIAALEGEPPRSDVAMTGTINSGGAIGTVSGVIGKARAAREAGIRTVVVPSLTSFGLEVLDDEENVSVANMSESFDESMIEELSGDGFRVVQATDLYDALPYFLDKEYAPPAGDVVVPQEYLMIMGGVSQTLCDRRDELLTAAEKEPDRVLESQIANASEKERYYAVASYCFSDNIELQELVFGNYTQGQREGRLSALLEELSRFEGEVEGRSLETISDLETYAIVRERIVDARERASEIDNGNVSASDLAYVSERLFSAEVWAEFFAMESREYVVDEEHLEEACFAKVSEAEERVTYVEGALPERLTEGARDDLLLARSHQSDGEFALCLFTASKAKGRANNLMSAMSVSEERLGALVGEKLLSVERVLARQSEQGLFPIMGFSYLEYARSLEESDPFSALTFSEYALEVGNLHVYFPSEEGSFLPLGVRSFEWELAMVFLFGLVAGAGVILLFYIPRRSPPKGRGVLPGKKR